MYSLIKSLSASELFTQQLPTFAISFGIAEMFYKFHSFVLETGAFLATWFVLDFLLQGIIKLVRMRSTNQVQEHLDT